MTRRALAVLLAAVLVLLALAILLPPHVASDVPAVSVVPASAFVPVKGGSTGDLLAATATPGATREGLGTGWYKESARPTTRTLTTATPAPVASPSASSVPSATPVRIPALTERAVAVTGTASWFASPIGVSAAGPALRTALGSGWRGTHVTVCSAGRCAVTVLGDWCACPRRAIDLDAPVFAALAPLSQGLVEVTVSWPAE